VPTSRRLPLPTLALALAAALLAAGCARPPARPRNLIFVLVDTLRADHLGAYGYRRDTSPAFDAFARGALLFADARSQSSCTFPSVNSLLTSRSPAAFVGQPGRAMGIPAGIASLAEVLRPHGFSSVAVSASPIVRRSPGRFNPGGGYGRGFDLFLEDCVWQPAECVNREALSYLRRGGPPLFLYLHYIDPHGPYSPPAGYRRRFALGTPAKAFIRAGNPNPIADHLYKGAPDPGVTAADVQHLVDLYDDEIGYVDSQFGRLLAAIARAGLAGDSIVVFAADHGEEFLEHGHVKHCRTVFDSSVRVPLALRIPGVAARGPVRVAASNLDLVPTLLDYLGVDAGGLPLEGRSLRPAIERGRAVEAAQFSAQGPLRAAAGGGFKLVHDLASGAFALYDLRADPGETRDVLRGHRRVFHRLREALSAWLARTEGAQAAAESVRKGEEAEKQLKALGYLE
jgi:choline-sulfatase